MQQVILYLSTLSKVKGWLKTVPFMHGWFSHSDSRLLCMLSLSCWISACSCSFIWMHVFSCIKYIFIKPLHITLKAMGTAGLEFCPRCPWYPLNEIFPSFFAKESGLNKHGTFEVLFSIHRMSSLARSRMKFQAHYCPCTAAAAFILVFCFLFSFFFAFGWKAGYPQLV